MAQAEPGNSLMFPAPEAAASLYPGDVMHARMKPKAHRFAYKVFCLLIDIDRLAEANRMSRLFSVNRFNLLGFREKDHGNGQKTGLSAHVRSLAVPAGVDISGGRILLLAYPRLMGFVFNPLSVYFCYGGTGNLAMVIYEVRNTFGEMHSYIAPIEPGELNEAGVRQERDKLFYVSPFIDMTPRYLFRLRPPGDTLNVRILETDSGGPLLSATFAGKRRDLTTVSVLKSCIWMPLMTLKVVAGIHWEALRLWLKGVRLQARPSPPEPYSFANGQGAKPTTVNDIPRPYGATPDSSESIRQAGA
jgi:uncharacterized protein